MWSFRILALIPQIFAVVLQIEADITTIRTGAEKRTAALDLVRQCVAGADAITGHPIIPNEAAFIASVGPVIDAIVAVLNSQQAAASATA